MMPLTSFRPRNKWGLGRSAGGFELLKADDVWRSFGKPSRKILQKFVDVVNVEGGDLHSSRPGVSTPP